jgi:hypothetical protein
MRVAYTNLIDAVTTASIVASSEDTSFPVDNVQDQRLTTKWHSEDVTTATVVIDLGATAACTIFAVLSHNLVSGGTVTVNGNDDIASGLTWVTSGESSTQTFTYNANAMVKFISSLSNRYWKFTFSGQTQNGIQIGRLWIGTYLSISPSSLDDFRVTKRRDDIVVYGRNRQKYASPGNTWRRFELTFPKTGGSMLTSIQTFYDAVGNHSSFIFCNFDDLRTYELVDPCYCSVEGDLSFSHVGRQYYTYSMIFEEDR